MRSHNTLGKLRLFRVPHLPLRRGRKLLGGMPLQCNDSMIESKLLSHWTEKLRLKQTLFILYQTSGLATLISWQKATLREHNQLQVLILHTPTWQRLFNSSSRKALGRPSPRPVRSTIQNLASLWQNRNRVGHLWLQISAVNLGFLGILAESEMHIR